MSIAIQECMLALASSDTEKNCISDNCPTLHWKKPNTHT
jgi:hypothetical protein